MSNSAAHVISKCGGARIIAGWLGCSVNAVYRWTYPAPQGTGGRIPAGRQELLLAAARANGVDLTPADFFADTAAADAA